MRNKVVSWRDHAQTETYVRPSKKKKKKKKKKGLILSAFPIFRVPQAPSNERIPANLMVKILLSKVPLFQRQFYTKILVALEDR